MADQDPPDPAQEPPALCGLVRALHHVAIAVPSLEEARGLYVDLLGMRASEPELVEHQGVTVQVLQAGAQRLELVEPARPDSPISRFLERRGGGIHHLAWSVDSVADTVAILKARGVKLIDETPQRGSHGTTVAFVHPSVTAGVLMELVEDPA